MPSLRKKASTAMAKCLRLVTPDKQPEGVISDTQSDEEAKRQEKEDLKSRLNSLFDS